MGGTRRRSILGTVAVMGLTWIVLGPRGGSAVAPACGVAMAGARSEGWRLLSALSTSTGAVVELRERLFDEAMHLRAAGREGVGPERKGVPSMAYYIVRRDAAASQASVLWCVYVHDWASRRLPLGAGAGYCAALAIDPATETVNVLVARSLTGRCEIENFTVSPTLQGATFDGEDPFPVEDPGDAWPAGAIAHEGRASETERVKLPTDLGPVTRVSLLCDEVGLLVHARTSVAAKAPVYLRRRRDGDRWRPVAITEE